MPNAPSGPILEVRDLTVEFKIDGQWTPVVSHVNLEVDSGEILGVVGESGSGKSVTAYAIMGLTSHQGGRLAGGTIRIAGHDIDRQGKRSDSIRRGRDFAMVFQKPMSSLNPAYKVGEQIAEGLRVHLGLSRRDAWDRAIGLLDRVQIPRASERVHDYPHQFSGGMLQRAMIASAISCSPGLLIADEATTALDVTVQAEILDLLRDVQSELGMAVVFITHDLSVVAELCTRVAVMYSGQMVETADVSSLFRRPLHPYTEGLMMTRPSRGDHRFATIPGNVPMPTEWPTGCRFYDRCSYGIADVCCGAPIEESERAKRTVRCCRSESLTLQGIIDRKAQ